jgi:hypothetical protein
MGTPHVMVVRSVLSSIDISAGVADQFASQGKLLQGHAGTRSRSAAILGWAG